jgi:hypothetical protein
MVDDETIIVRCQAGEMSFLNMLIHRYSAPLCSFCN